jgi:ribose transport system substrate-binding protein
VEFVEAKRGGENMKRSVTIIVCLAMVLAFGSVVAAKDITIGFSVSTLANPFFVTMKEGGEQKAKELGVSLITLDAQDSPEKQISQVEDLLARNVDVLIINPYDSDAIGTAVLEANRAGVPVITVTRPSNRGTVLQHLDIDNAMAGAMVAEELVRVLDGKGKVAILEGIPGAPSAVQRQEGFLKAIEAYEGVEVVSSLTANYSREEAASIMEDVLQANPKLDAVYGHNDEMALGAVRALASAGRLAEVKVFGIDAIDDALEAIKKNEMVATIMQQPALQMAMAVESAIEVVKGNEVDPLRIIPLLLVNSDNVDEVAP